MRLGGGVGCRRCRCIVSELPGAVGRGLGVFLVGSRFVCVW